MPKSAPAYNLITTKRRCWRFIRDQRSEIFLIGRKAVHATICKPPCRADRQALNSVPLNKAHSTHGSLPPNLHYPGRPPQRATAPKEASEAHHRQQAKRKDHPRHDGTVGAVQFCYYLLVPSCGPRLTAWPIVELLRLDLLLLLLLASRVAVSSTRRTKAGFRTFHSVSEAVKPP